MASIDFIEGNCLEQMGSLGLFDAIITSPPYNLGVSTGGGFGPKSRWKGTELDKGYGVHDDAMDPFEYGLWQKTFLLKAWECLTDRGAIFYNHKPRVQAGQLQTPLDYNPGLPVRQIIIWDRGSGFNYSPTFFVPNHEWIVVFAKPEFRLKDKKVSGKGDVWRIPFASKEPHPCPFPVELPTRILQSIEADRVLDPFMGQGTTGIACHRNDVNFVGIELNPDYIGLAQEKLDHERSQLSLI
jgi:modification methylase